MKKFLMTAFAVLMALAASAQLRVSVLGDSYSTFDGLIPAGNEPWYFTDTQGNDVNAPEQTWWSIMTDANGLVLEKNDSYSGATVSYSGYRGEDYKDRSFNTRANRLGNPEVIFIFGGTNDDWAKSPIGEFKYSGWTEEDMYSFRPAFAHLLDNLRKLYPEALVINISNSDLGRNVTESMSEICKHYGVPNIQLHHIDKQRNHPSQSGMRQIAYQVWKQSAPHIYNHLSRNVKQ
ncbi:MAG: SGNH/GDSL hydrolase family protein [Muribaculum sp.]|nr:SGNH/GDSL hydrolase family protein [Muribaculum sp.]